MEEVNYFIEKEQILEICFWFKGEGFGDEFSPLSISPFLKHEESKISRILEKLCDEGSLIETNSKHYKFTDIGLKQAGKLFVETFQEMQQPGHYECHDGCCDGDDHSKCKHN